MRNLLTISCFAVLARYGFGIINASEDPPAVSPNLPPVLSVPPVSRSPVQPSSLSPGVYRATSYSMVVIAPKSVDPQMVVTLRSSASSVMPSINPGTSLQKQ